MSDLLSVKHINKERMKSGRTSKPVYLCLNSEVHEKYPRFSLFDVMLKEDYEPYIDPSTVGK